MLAPDGVEERGFSGKNILADQRSLAGDASVIVDAGAYDGALTAAYLELFPTAVCHALEPHAESFRTLSDRLGGHPRARLHKLALADVAGTVLLHAFPTSATSSLLSPVENVAAVVGRGHMDHFRHEKVEAITLDGLAEREGMTRIDILKLDVQGAEALVLRGADRLLRSRAVGLIVTELNFVQVYRSQARYFEVAALLTDLGFRLYDFYNFHYGPQGQLQWGDAIFVR